MEQVVTQRAGLAHIDAYPDIHIFRNTLFVDRPTDSIGLRRVSFAYRSPPNRVHERLYLILLLIIGVTRQTTGRRSLYSACFAHPCEHHPKAVLWRWLLFARSQPGCPVNLLTGGPLLSSP